MSEEFKAIIELLEGAGDGVMWVVIAYMVWKFLTIALCWVGGFILAKIIIVAIQNLVCICNEAPTALRQLRDRWGLGSGYLSCSEISDVMNKIINLEKEAKK